MEHSKFKGLESTGYNSYVPIAPEEEFFHSVYVAGVTRKNQSGVDEKENKLQIRGVEYNLDEIHMIITHTKGVLAKIMRDPSGKEKTMCFSYQEGNAPWEGSSGTTCGQNSAERADSEYCKQCRAQLIVAGMLCDSEGSITLDKNNKPIFIFIRGKGMKYSGVADYLNECSHREYPKPLFDQTNPEAADFEKSVVNNKRNTTKISITEVDSKYGPKKVFDLCSGVLNDDDTVMKVLEIAKKTLTHFNEKMDWSKNIKAANREGSEDLTKIPEGPVKKNDKEKSNKIDLSALDTF